MKTKYLILGGGPAGLSLACALLKRGETDLIVAEKEDTPGGLCRSETVDGAPLDIGGGHFLDVRRPNVTEFLFDYMPQKEWNKFERDSRIRLPLLPKADAVRKKEYELHHPFEANIWELPSAVQKRFLDSISAAGCNTGVPAPTKFTDWIVWKLGEEIAQEYMLPYNRKMYGDDLDKLGTYWLDKLPNVSYEQTLESCKQKKALGSEPGHAKFYYPKKYGYGEVFKRMGEELGDKLKLNETVTSLDCMSNIATFESGSVISAETIIVTVPWDTMELKWAPSIIKDSVKSLKKTSIEVTYHEETLDTDAQWIYYPDETLPYHRILVRSNFCKNAKGYWTETRSQRYEPGLLDRNYHSEYAYPLNTADKPAAMNRILGFMSRSNIYGLGRWGEHSHFNSDVTIDRALKLASKI